MEIHTLYYPKRMMIKRCHYNNILEMIKYFFATPKKATQ